MIRAASRAGLEMHSNETVSVQDNVDCPPYLPPGQQGSEITQPVGSADTQGHRQQKMLS